VLCHRLVFLCSCLVAEIGPSVRSISDCNLALCKQKVPRWRRPVRLCPAAVT